MAADDYYCSTFHTIEPNLKIGVILSWRVRVTRVYTIIYIYSGEQKGLRFIKCENVEKSIATAVARTKG